MDHSNIYTKVPKKPTPRKFGGVSHPHTPLLLRHCIQSSNHVDELHQNSASIIHEYTIWDILTRTQHLVIINEEDMKDYFCFKFHELHSLNHELNYIYPLRSLYNYQKITWSIKSQSDILGLLILFTLLIYCEGGRLIASEFSNSRANQIWVASNYSKNDLYLKDKIPLVNFRKRILGEVSGN